jgi:hypothetical protein
LADLGSPRTANRLVLHSAEVVHFHHKSRKSLEELWTQPCDVGQASYHTTKVWLHKDATRPLQRVLLYVLVHSSLS